MDVWKKQIRLQFFGGGKVIRFVLFILMELLGTEPMFACQACILPTKLYPPCQSIIKQNFSFKTRVPAKFVLALFVLERHPVAGTPFGQYLLQLNIRVFHDPAIPLLSLFPTEMLHVSIKINVQDVHNCIIHTQTLEGAQLSSNREMKTVWCIQKTTLYSKSNEQILLS